MDDRENRRLQLLGGSGSAGEVPLPASGLAMLLKERFEGMTGRDLRDHTKRGDVSPAAHSFSGGVDVSARSLSNQIIAKRDVAIIDAVSERLGRDDWIVREIRERLIFEIQGGATIVTFDGEPLLTIYPPEFEVKEDGPSTYLTAKQRIWRRNETG